MVQKAMYESFNNSFYVDKGKVNHCCEICLVHMCNVFQLGGQTNIEHQISAQTMH